MPKITRIPRKNVNTSNYRPVAVPVATEARKKHMHRENKTNKYSENKKKQI